MKNIKWIIVSCLAIIALAASVAMANPSKHQGSAGFASLTQPDEGEPGFTADSSGEEGFTVADSSGEEGFTSADGDDSGSVTSADGDDSGSVTKTDVSTAGHGVSISTMKDATNGSKACKAVIYFVCRTKDGQNWCVKATKWICG